MAHLLSKARVGARSLAALIAVGGVAACSDPTTSVRYDAVHPISVELSPQILELPATTDLSPRDAAQLDAFIGEYKTRGENEVTIAYPSDAPAESVVHEIEHRILDAGVRPDAIVRGPYSREADGDRGVVVSFLAPTASTAGCSRYFGDPTLSTTNGYLTRTGCATRGNLAAMVAEPRDLVAPRTMSPADLSVRKRAVSALRSGEDPRSATRTDELNTQ